MRSVDIFRSAIANSFRSRTRTGLTVIAIFIGAFTLTITNGIGTGVNDYIDTQLGSIGAADVLNVSKPATTDDESEGPAPYDPEAGSEISSDTGPPGSTVLAMTEDDLDRIAAVDLILSVEPLVAVRPDFVEYDGNGRFELATSAFSAGVRLDLAAGATLDQNTDDFEIVLPTSYIDTLGFGSDDDAVGADVTIGITDAAGTQQTLVARVVGVQEPTLFGTVASTNDALTGALFDAQSEGLPETADRGFASATARFDASVPDDQIEAMRADLVDAGYITTTVADQIGTFQQVVDGIILVLNAFAIIALIAAAFGIVNTLLMSVQERTREIGLMKAMGMSGSRIFALFSAEAVFIGFLGSAIGAAVAIAIGSVVSAVLADGLLADLAGLQLLAFAPLSVLGVLALVMGIAFVAGTLPAYRAARQNPIDALRYE